MSPLFPPLTLEYAVSTRKYDDAILLVEPINHKFLAGTHGLRRLSFLFEIDFSRLSDCGNQSESSPNPSEQRSDAQFMMLLLNNVPFFEHTVDRNSVLSFPFPLSLHSVFSQNKIEVQGMLPFGFSKFSAVFLDCTGEMTQRIDREMLLENCKLDETMPASPPGASFQISV